MGKKRKSKSPEKSPLKARSGKKKHKERLDERVRALVESRLREERDREQELLAMLRTASAARPSERELEARLDDMRSALERELAEGLRRRWAQESARLERHAQQLGAQIPAAAPLEAQPPSVAQREELLAVVEERLRSSRDQDLRHREALFGRALRWVGIPLSVAFVVLGAAGLRALSDLRAVAGAIDRMPDGARTEPSSAAPRTSAESILLRVTRARPRARSLSRADHDRLMVEITSGEDPDALRPALQALALAAGGTRELADLASSEDLPVELRVAALEALAAGDPGATGLEALARAGSSELPRLRATGLAGLAAHAPAHELLEELLQSGALETADSLTELAPFAALLGPLARSPARERDEDLDARVAHSARILGRALREPFLLESGGENARFLYVSTRGAAAQRLPLGDPLNSAGFQNAADALLREAASQPTLAALHARVDRLTCPSGDGDLFAGERPFVVRAHLGAGARAVLRDGAELDSGRLELSILSGPIESPLVARPIGPAGEPLAKWRPLRYLERPERIGFGLGRLRQE